MPVQDLVREKAQTSELTKQVSELTSENEKLKAENQALASDNMEMSIRLKGYEVRMADRDTLLSRFLDQNQNLTKELVTMNESYKTVVESMNASMTSKFTALAHSLRKISADTSVLSQKGGEVPKSPPQPQQPRPITNPIRAMFPTPPNLNIPNLATTLPPFPFPPLGQSQTFFPGNKGVHIGEGSSTSQSKPV